MKKTLLVLILCLIAWPCYAGSNCYVLGSDGGDTPCNASTDSIGDTDIEGDGSGGLTEDRMYAVEYTPVCASGCSSGTTTTAYVYHNDTNSDNIKFCLYSSDGDAPDNGDALVGCATLSSSAVEWASSALAQSVSCGTDYWVVLITDSSGWINKYASSGPTMYYLTSAGSYSSPPSDLTGSWSNLTREYSAYVKIGP